MGALIDRFKVSIPLRHACVLAAFDRSCESTDNHRMFSEKEIAYLHSQRLARIATVSSDGKPDVAPVGFTFKSGRFLVGGMDLKRTLKYTNAKATGHAAIVVDDLHSADPQPRGIKVHEERPNYPN